MRRNRLSATGRRVAGFTLLLVAVAVSGPAGAAGNVACHASSSFFVIGRERTDEVGTDFLVRRRASPNQAVPCLYVPETSDLRIGTASDALHFEAVGGRHLVLTDSTGPSATLVVYDMGAGRRILSERLTEASETKVEGDKVSVTLRVAAATAKTCRQLPRFTKQGGSGEIGMAATFDMATGTLTRGTKTACTYAQ